MSRSVTGTIAKNTSIGFIASLLEIAVVFVIGIVLARSLGTEQYGLYAYLIWFLGLLAIVSNLGLGEMARRFIPESIGRQSASEPVGLVQFTLLVRITVAVIVAVVIIVSSGFWSRLAGAPGEQMVFVLCALASIPQAVMLALTNIFKGFQKFEYAFYIMIAMIPLRLVLVIIFMALGYGVQEIFLIFIATLVVGVLVGLFLLHRLVPLQKLFLTSQLSGDTRRRAIRYAITMAGMLALAYLVDQQVEVFIIGMYCSVEEVGFYNIAFRLGSLMSLLPTALAFALISAIAEQFGKGDMERIQRIYISSARWLMMVVLPMAAGVIVLADSIVIIIYGVEYTPTILLLQVLSLPFGIHGIAIVSDSVIRGINRPGFLLQVMVLFTVVKIGLSVWLIPEHGVLGAAIATAAPRVITLPIYAVYLYRKIGSSWPVGDALKVVLASLFMGLIIYVVSSQLGVILSLVICIPLGVILYIIALLTLRAASEQDIAVLYRAEKFLPSVFRKYYSNVIGFLEKFVVRTDNNNG